MQFITKTRIRYKGKYHKAGSIVDMPADYKKRSDVVEPVEKEKAVEPEKEGKK